ncbi:MAG: hypothetical protein H8E44_17510 [Planctomycetes bacterium]|nr:hypothetical protein [Planctomycetota bacterium]
MRYQWLILQGGSLPLRPDGRTEPQEHLCTSTLVWPADREPSFANSIVVDPCFGPSGFESVVRRLSDMDASFRDIGYCLETHQHYDHVSNLPTTRSLLTEGDSESANMARWVHVGPDDSIPLPGIELISCPGHEPDLMALRFDALDGETWIVGDAILDQQWLLAWLFYWPNGYLKHEIVETWRTVAKILDTAQVVIPGHGPPIRVDADLLQTLIDRFPHAPYSDSCPEVAETLSDRLQRLGD